MKRIFYSLITQFAVFSSFSQLPAFPGAEGFGALTSGGRGGQVIYVTNLNCVGPGSLNEALATPGPKYILFKVSGIIDCAAEIIEGDCYIAGQSSPDGIIVRGIIADNYYNPASHPDNVILRHIRSRGIGTHPTSNYATDPLIISGVNQMIVDHCTLSNSDDEAIDISRSQQLSIQNCLLAETVGSHFDLGGMLLNYSTPSHRMDSISIHHNNWNRLGGRMPEFSCEDPSGCSGSIFHIEYSCNLLWDQQRVVYHNIDTDLANGSDPGQVEPWFLRANFVNNFGMSRPAFCEAMFLNTFLERPENQLFVSGNQHNRYPGYQDYDLFNCCSDFCTQGSPNTDLGSAQLLNSRHPYPLINYHTAAELPAYMIDAVGAFPRFPHENRLMQAVADNTFASADLSVNAADDLLDLPVFSHNVPNDSDSDGMPDYWEDIHGLNPALADHNDTNLSPTITGVNGYTNLECYLNCLAEAIVNGSTPQCGISLGVKEQEPGEWSFSPNPAQNQLLIYQLNKPNIEIQITDLHGKVVQKTLSNGEKQMTLELNKLENGIYFLQIGKTVKILELMK